MLVDTGDTLFGKSPSNESHGALPIAAMNAMGYDAMALGQVDLGDKADVLRTSLQQASFAVLSVNLGPAGVLPMQPYTIKEVAGYKVAIIGVTASRAKEQAERLGVTLEVEKAVEAVRRTVEELRDQVDVIVLLSNLVQNTNLTLAQETGGIDIIVGTRDANSPAQVQLINGPDGRVVLQGSGTQGQQLARLTVKFDASGVVVGAEGQGILLSGEYTDDPDMLQLLEEYGVAPSN